MDLRFFTNAVFSLASALVIALSFVARDRDCFDKLARGMETSWRPELIRIFKLSLERSRNLPSTS